MNHWQRILSIIKYPQHVANDNKDLMLYQVSDDFFNKPKLWCFRLLSSGLFLLPTFCWQVISWVWHKVPPSVRRYSVGDEFWISPLSASANARHKLRSLIWRVSLDIWKGWVEHILLLCRILHRADVHLHYSWLRITFLQKNMFLQQKVSDRIQNFYLPNSAWNKPNAHRLKSTWLPNCEFRHGLWKYLNILATPQNTPPLTIWLIMEKPWQPPRKLPVANSADQQFAELNPPMLVTPATNFAVEPLGFRRALCQCIGGILAANQVVLHCLEYCT